MEMSTFYGVISVFKTGLPAPAEKNEKEDRKSTAEHHKAAALLHQHVISFHPPVLGCTANHSSIRYRFAQPETEHHEDEKWR